MKDRVNGHGQLCQLADPDFPGTNLGMASASGYEPRADDDDDDEEDVEALVRRLQQQRMADEEACRHTCRQQWEEIHDAVAEMQASEAAYNASVSVLEHLELQAEARAEARAEAMDRAQITAEALTDAKIERMERSFSEGDNAAHLIKWQQITDLQSPDVLQTKELADVLTLIVAALMPFTCQFLLRLRLSRALTAAVHEALRHVTVVSLTDVNVACARTLATFCTGLQVLDVSLMNWGEVDHEQFRRPVHQLNIQQSGRDQQTQIELLLPGMLMRSTPWWLASLGADAYSKHSLRTRCPERCTLRTSLGT